jgi:outer membrane receptor protein involved in Fe transport
MIFVVLALVAAALLAPLTAWSQIEEIVVTVRKKSESLQDIPISITAFGSAEIDRKGISSVGDVAKLSSSVQFDESFAQSDTRIVIRGLSPTRGRQNAAILVDGIDLSSEAITSSGGSLLLNTRLIDVERIEVVKGPQMALYGRAAFNGAIQYITKDPSEVFEAEVKLDGNSEDQYDGTASVSGPVFGDLLGVRLNATWWDDEGSYDNSLTGSDIGGGDGVGFALTTKSEFDNGLSLKFRAEYVDDSGDPSPQAFLPFNTVLDVPENAKNPNDVPGQPGTPGGSGIAECYPTFVDALATGVPGNAQGLVDRINRIVDPAVAAQLAASGNTPEEIVVNNPFLSPNCEYQQLAYVGKAPDGDDTTVRLGTDPSNPGSDYEGFDRDLWRVSLQSEWELEKGSFTLLAGYLHDDNTEKQDTNAFGVFDPTSPFLDSNVNSFAFNNEKVTEQTSFELRYATNYEGPVNVTVGGLYWEEDVDNDSNSITAQASGSHCMWSSPGGVLNPLGLPDGCTGYTETAYSPYQQYAQPLRRESPANRNTENSSVYGMLDLELTETVNLGFEGRYNQETTTVEGPLAYTPGASGGPGGLNPCGIFFRACEPYDDWLNNGKFFGDAFFPYEEVTVNGVDTFVLDQNQIDAIPGECWQQDGAAVQNSIDNGPALQVRDANGNPVPDGGAPELVLDANGRAVPNGSTDLFNPWCVGSLKNDDSWFSPKVSIDWRAMEDVLLYASWSDARKPGGFSMLTVGSSFLSRELSAFKPEKMEVWELGGNSSWIDNTWVVNGAVFYQDYTDKQALTSVLNESGDRLVSKIVNAGSAEVWGAELAVTWSPISTFLKGSWSMSGSYTWLDTEYTNFEVTSTSPTTTAAAGNCQTVQDPDGNLTCLISYSGNELEDAPPGAFVGSVQYTFPLTAQLDLFVETDVQWTDRRYTGVTNNIYTDSFTNTDFYFGLQADTWDVLMYVTNVFDDDTTRSVGGGPGLGCCFDLGSGIDLSGNGVPAPVMVDLPLFSTAFKPPPRIVGMRASYRFGGE